MNGCSFSMYVFIPLLDQSPWRLCCSAAEKRRANKIERTMWTSKRERENADQYGWKYKINDENRKTSSHRNAICTSRTHTHTPVQCSDCINQQREMRCEIREDGPSTLHCHNHHHHHHHHHHHSHYHQRMVTLNSRLFVLYSSFFLLFRLIYG